MVLIGGEKWFDRRYGQQEYTYYLGNGFIEGRHLTGDKRGFYLRRYIVPDAPAVAQELRQIIAAPPKKGGGCEELLWRYPHADGYVDIEQADRLDRKIIKAGGTNLDPKAADAIWQR